MWFFSVELVCLFFSPEDCCSESSNVALMAGCVGLVSSTVFKGSQLKVEW